jgi:hypothetical protein
MLSPRDVFDSFSDGCQSPLDFARRVWSEEHFPLGEIYAEHHPLGFTKVELTPIISGSSVSLHIWDRCERTPIHSHHFDMESIVIRGALLDVEHEITECETDGMSVFSLLYREDLQERSFKREMGRFSTSQKRARLVCGCTYSLAKSIFHSTRAVFPQTVSVMLRRNISREGSAFVARGDFVPEGSPDISISKDHVLDILTKLDVRNV